MARMPNFEEDIKRDFRWFSEHAEHVMHPGDHPYAPLAPAATPVNLTAAPAAQPEENDMSLLDTIKTHVEADVAELEGKLKGVDDAALAVLNRVLANPETASVLKDLDGLATIVGIPSGTIAGVAGGLKTVLSLYADAAPAAPVQPEQPVAAPEPVAAQ